MYLKESYVTLLQVVEVNWWCDHALLIWQFDNYLIFYYQRVFEPYSLTPWFFFTPLSQDLFISCLHMYLFISSQSPQPLTLFHILTPDREMFGLLISPHKYYAGFRPLLLDRISDNPITPPTDKQLPVQPFLLLVYTPSPASIVCLGGKEIEPTR